MSLAELLSRHGFHRHALLRNQVGHLQLIGQLQGRPIDILIDTGAGEQQWWMSLTAGKRYSSPGYGTIRWGLLAELAFAIYASMALFWRWTAGRCALTASTLSTLTHVNEGLTMKGATRVHGVLGQDVLTYHRAVTDYATMSLFLIMAPNHPW